MPQSAPQLISDFRKFLDSAVQARDSGDIRAAIEYAYLASKRLRDLLDLTEDEDLRDTRLGHLREIAAWVEEMDAELDREPMPAGSPGPEAKGQTKGEKRFAVEERPALKLEDVAGMEELKELIRSKLIYPLKDPELTASYKIKTKTGILLYGPPGTGKSMVARAIAGEFDAAFISVKASDIIDSLYGGTEKNIAALFAQAREYPACVLFIDEIDSIGANRDGGDSHMRRFLNQLLAEIQGFSEGNENTILLTATNKPWLMDPALIRSGRIDEFFHVPLPDATTRRRIWELNLRGKKTEGGIDLERLARESEGLSGADVAAICDKANREAFAKAFREKRSVPVTESDLLRLFPTEPSVLHRADLERLDAFARMHDRNRSFAEATAQDVRTATNGEAAPSEETAEREPIVSHGPSIPASDPDSESEVVRFLAHLFAAVASDPDVPELLQRQPRPRGFGDLAALFARILRFCTDPASGRLRRITSADVEAVLQAARAVGETEPVVEVPRSAPEAESSGVQWPETAVAIPPGSVHSLDVPVILKLGDEILARLGGDLRQRFRGLAREHLYRLAKSAEGVETFDKVGFARVILELKDAQADEEAYETVGEAGDEEPLQPPPETPTLNHETFLEAMAFLDLHRRDLGTDWKGFVDEIENSRVFDLAKFREQVLEHLDAKREHERFERFHRLFEERKGFLPPETIGTLEKEIADGQPDIEHWIALIEEQSYEKYLDSILADAANGADYDPQLLGKLVRKAKRELSKKQMSPTVQSARNLLARHHRVLEKARSKLDETAERVRACKPRLVDPNDIVLRPEKLIDFGDVAGMSTLKDRLETGVDNFLSPHRREITRLLMGKNIDSKVGVLLYGAPGTGKTFFSLAAAGELLQQHEFHTLFIPLDYKDIHYTKKIPTIKEVFRIAREIAPTLMIWEEFDVFASPQRLSGRKYDDVVVTALKAELDGIEKSDKVVVHLGSTNNPWLIDPALIRDGRFSNTLHVMPPDTRSRRALLNLHLGNARLEPCFDMNALVQASELMTVAELQRVIKEAKDVVVDELMTAPDRAFRTEDFLSQIELYPAKDFRTWLSTAAEELGKAKFRMQREAYPELLKAIDRYLGD
ncbi:MAG: ATP-binding protein [Opitutales bacterium]|nr:ATP-binding protein [Opitutales bacterium]